MSSVIHNRTAYSQAELDAFDLPLLVTVDSKWRQRIIKVYEHPEIEGRVISIGVTYDGVMCVIADESKGDWKFELASGRPHVVTQ